MEGRACNMEVDRYYTPLPLAITQLEQRCRDPVLRSRVEEYLHGDIPAHFRNVPVLYLARHVATPNQETLLFLERCKRHQYPAVIGQDHNDVFVSHNSLKRSLGKLPILRGLDRNGAEVIEYVTVLDFNISQGRKLRELQTFAGTPLTEFHIGLFQELKIDSLRVADETAWIDRHQRGQVAEHYKRHLALFLAHGILFEYFLPSIPAERQFLSRVFAPAFEFINDMFGVRPLVVPLVEPGAEAERNWEAYPPTLAEFVQRHARRRRRDLGSHEGLRPLVST
jgi:hypothetical protein